MNATEHDKHTDPLGLRELDLLEPDRDGWDEIRSALEADAATPRRSRHLPWLFCWRRSPISMSAHCSSPASCPA